MSDRIKKAARKVWDAIADDVIRGSCECSGTKGFSSRCCETVMLSKGEVLDIVSDQMHGGCPYSGDEEACKYFYEEVPYEYRRELLSEEFTCSSYGY